MKILLLPGCLCLLTSAVAGGTPATGTMAWTCSPSFGARIYLDGAEGLQLLYSQGSGYKLEPHRNIPMRMFSCGAPDCHDLGEATVVFDTYSAEVVSGSYTVTHQDGTTQKATFKVVRAKQPKPFLCE